MDYLKISKLILDKNKYNEAWLQALDKQAFYIMSKIHEAKQQMFCLRIVFVLLNIKEFSSESTFWNTSHNR
jgi:hypothetical protein